jgi:hypothetical protein
MRSEDVYSHFEANPLEITLSFSQPVECAGERAHGNAASRLEVESPRGFPYSTIVHCRNRPQQAYRTLGVWRLAKRCRCRAYISGYTTSISLSQACAPRK